MDYIWDINGFLMVYNPVTNQESRFLMAHLSRIDLLDVAPFDSVQLPYKWLNSMVYGRLDDITIVNEV